MELTATLERELAVRLCAAAGNRGDELNRASQATVLVDGLGSSVPDEARKASALNVVAAVLWFEARNPGGLSEWPAALATALSVSLRMEAVKGAAARTPGDIQTVTARASGSVAQVRAGERWGTAFYIGDAEWITAEHVISGETSVRLVNAAAAVTATVKGAHADADLALLTAKSSAEPLELGTTPFQAAPVLVLGYGLGQRGAVAAAKDGIVSERYPENGLNYIRTNAAVNSGDSGGPLLNAFWGDVAGVVLTKLTSGSVQGVAYALGADSVRSLLPGLRGQRRR